MPDTSLLKRILFFLLLNLCFVLIPAGLTFLAVEKAIHNSEAETQSEIKIGLQKAIKESLRDSNSEVYWGRVLAEKFHGFHKSDLPVTETIEWLQNLKVQTGLFDYIVWNKTGQTLADSRPCNFSQEALECVFHELNKLNYYNNRTRIPYNPDATAIQRIRHILGNQYVHNMIEDNLRPKSYGFAWTDSSGQKPLIWSYFSKRAGYLILIDRKILTDISGLKRLMQNLTQKERQNFGLVQTNDQFKIFPEELAENLPDLKGSLQQCETEMLTFYARPDYYLCYAFLKPGLRIFCTLPRNFSPDKTRLLSSAAAIFVMLLMLPFTIYSYRTSIQLQPGTIMIRPRIAFVFFFACGLPFSAMIMVAREHYHQKHATGLKQAYQQTLNMLQNYDTRMQSIISRYEYQMKTFLENWADNMQNRPFNDDANNLIREKCRELSVDSFFLVCSHTPIVGSYNGVDHFRETLEEQKLRDQKHEYDESGNQIYRNSDAQNSQVANLIGKRIMGELNGEPRSNKNADRMELLFESIMQKSFAEITHSFIKAMGGISPWGFGQTVNLALLNFMSAGTSEKIDFMGLIIWSGKIIQREYARQSIGDINRNAAGVKFYLKNFIDQKNFPADVTFPEEVEKIFERITDTPNEEIETIKIDNQEYMIIGFTGKHMNYHKLLALYPLSILEKRVFNQKVDLILLGIFCILLTAWLANLLSQSFITPLQQLQQTAQAIEKRNFSARVNYDKKDEFGEVAEIFDGVMVSLEELEVAKIVQESLFPEEAMQQNNFRIYGKSLTMSELGGDYFDYFPIDSNHFAALMGDVAGHGVGAALIMAMARAGIIKCEKELNQPARVLKRLHELILASKTKRQKKIMTFQYISANSETGKVSYANAGGCSPIIIRREKNHIEEVTLAGAALGAFKKASFNELELQFNNGDMMVFYTDGIIESRNRLGVEMGYHGFAELVKRSWSNDPEMAYNAICEGYRQHLDGEEAQDDLTMVVICYNRPV